MEQERRAPLATTTNVATAQAIKQYPKSKMPGPTTGIPRPGIPRPQGIPRPGIPTLNQGQQQKRKASPVKENPHKRTKVEHSNGTLVKSSSSAMPSAPKTRTVQAKTAVRPSQAKAKSVATTKPVRKPSVTVAATTRPTRMSDSKPPSNNQTTQPQGKKRAAWDLKGRLQDMEEAMKTHLTQNSNLQTEKSVNQDRICVLVNEKESLELQIKESLQEVSQLQAKLRKSETDHYEEMRQFKHQVEELQFTSDRLQRQKTSLESELSAKQTEICGLKSSLSELSSFQQTIKAEMDAIKVRLDNALLDASVKGETIVGLEVMVKTKEEKICELHDNLMEEERIRRKLHNEVQELKGNIRVFCRVRPLIKVEKEVQNGEISHINFLGEKSMELDKLQDVGPNETLGNRKGSNKYEFDFDRVFDPEATQEHVFSEISQLVQSSLDGYNVCIFAYGQTGSGKTFTMEGPEQVTADTRGMIPRAVEKVFQTSEELCTKGWHYEMEASFLEIYNETIRDLLDSRSNDTKHEIKMVPNSHDTSVTNLTTVSVKGLEQVEKLLSKASENRAVGATLCNERSSRSHSVFRLKISGHNQTTEEKCTGILNLIDLAGSERLKESGSQGARLKETLSINKSLSTLGNVIMALANKDSHIPYRNSKLTHLLQNSLGGNSKTLMFVNVSPREENFSETLNSLRFAKKVNNCSIGTATKKSK